MTRDQVRDFFLSNAQFDKAVELCIRCRTPEAAVELCERHQVQMTCDAPDV